MNWLCSMAAPTTITPAAAALAVAALIALGTLWRPPSTWLPIVASASISRAVEPLHAHHHEFREHGHGAHKAHDAHDDRIPQPHCHAIGEGGVCCLHGMSCCVVVDDAGPHWPNTANDRPAGLFADDRSPTLSAPHPPPRPAGG